MDRGRRFKATPPAPGESDAAGKRRLRRAVVDDMRRKTERALGVAAPAEELAKATQAVPSAAEAEHIDLEGLSALRAALAHYREARGG